jgi:hypothetical protein
MMGSARNLLATMTAAGMVLFTVGWVAAGGLNRLRLSGLGGPDVDRQRYIEVGNAVRYARPAWLEQAGGPSGIFVGPVENSGNMWFSALVLLLPGLLVMVFALGPMRFVLRRGRVARVLLAVSALGLGLVTWFLVSLYDGTGEWLFEAWLDPVYPLAQGSVHGLPSLWQLLFLGAVAATVFSARRSALRRDSLVAVVLMLAAAGLGLHGYAVPATGLRSYSVELFVLIAAAWLIRVCAEVVMSAPTALDRS